MNKEIKVIPAIIPKDFDHLRADIMHVKNHVNRVQIDVLDGMYTPEPSWPYVYHNDSIFENIVGQEEGMPYWQDVSFEIDMMISNPDREYKKWIDAGASALIFHLESLVGDKVAFIKKVREESDVEIGIAIQTKTPNKELEPFLDIVDFVQFMGIEKIGFQGQEFDDKVLNKIKVLREERPDMDISVDGSVNFKTVEKLARAGANIFVSGSALLKSEDIDDAVKEMRELATNI
jgi:ribulose-phosphate 3-epimerase